MDKTLKLAAALLVLSACASSRSSAPPKPSGKLVLRLAHMYLPQQRLRPLPLDCSDFVQRVFAEAGVKLPRTSKDMSRVGTRVDSQRKLRSGDLVLFSGEKVSREVGHVGIYAGGGRFIHKPTDKPVAEERLDAKYYRLRYLGGRRVF